MDWKPINGVLDGFVGDVILGRSDGSLQLSHSNNIDRKIITNQAGESCYAYEELIKQDFVLWAPVTKPMMKKNSRKLSVVITGYAGAGKTTVACALMRLLEEHGAIVTLVDDSGPYRSGFDAADFIDNVAPTLDVTIETQMAIRATHST